MRQEAVKTKKLDDRAKQCAFGARHWSEVSREMKVFFDNSAPKKSLSIPTFDGQEYDGGRLECPACRNDYMHHDRVEIFECGEDAAHGLRVVVADGQVTTDTSLKGNPSARRHGLRVHFWCEHCKVRSFMEISQHKGNTYVGMGKVTPTGEN